MMQKGKKFHKLSVTMQGDCHLAGGNMLHCGSSMEAGKKMVVVCRI